MNDPARRFAEFAPFLATWAHPTEHARSLERWRATPASFDAFYHAVLPRLDELLAYLDEFELGAMPEEALPYFHLALAFAEVAPHCELYAGSSSVPNSFDAHRFVAAHGSIADT